MDSAGKTKKSIYKRAWFWLLLSPFIVAVLFVLTAIVIGIAGGFDDELNQQVVEETQPIMQNEASTAMPTPQQTFTPTIVPNKTPNPTATATPTLAPTKTPKPTSTPTLTPSKTPKPTLVPTPKPTIKPSPTTRPTQTPSPTLDPAQAPYGVDINGNPGPDFITLMLDFENALETMTGQEVEISTFEDDWYIMKGNFGYNLTTDCKIAKYKHEVVLKIEYDETYEHFKVFQLKIDGVNIDF